MKLSILPTRREAIFFFAGLLISFLIVLSLTANCRSGSTRFEAIGWYELTEAVSLRDVNFFYDVYQLEGVVREGSVFCVSGREHGDLNRAHFTVYMSDATLAEVATATIPRLGKREMKPRRSDSAGGLNQP